MNYKTLKDLLLLKALSLSYVESEIAKSLPKVIDKVKDSELKSGLMEHLEETRLQAGRLERILWILGEKPKKEKSEAIDGLINDMKWVLKHIKQDEVLDAAVIGAALYIEHYEMAGYQSAISWAELLEENEIMNLLQESLNEEENAAHKMSNLAMTKINARAKFSEGNNEED